jgi:putative endonuclease
MAMSGLLHKLWRRETPGSAGEGMACRHLQGKGLAIVARNFRCRSGEIDIVARDGATTIFVEVKERHGRSHGEGYEAVTFGKRRRLIRAARIYAAIHGLSETPLRFDVIWIEWIDAVTPVIRHDAGAFDSDGS